MIRLTPGKLEGLRAVSNERGVIAAAAMDQRGSLQKSLAKERGISDVPAGALEEFKTLVTDVLTQYASAILLDPEYGLPASKHRHDAGLLLAYEKTGYDATEPGRLPDLLDHWSVRRLKEAGADCIKVLLYYTPFEKSEINDQKHAFIERIGDECRAHDIPFFLEFVGYAVHGEDEKGLEYAKRKPSIVSGSMAEFGKEKYGVDVLKVEVPVQMEFVQGSKAFKGESRLHPRRSAAALPRRRFHHPQALHLSVGWCFEPGLHRDSPARRRVRSALQRRPLRPRHLEGRHQGLRPERPQSLPRLARHPGRREHLERQPGPPESPLLVRQSRPDPSGRRRPRGLNWPFRQTRSRKTKAPRQGRFGFNWKRP